MYFKSLVEILLLLLANIHPPLLVIHIFVEFLVGTPLETYTCIGSSFSLFQKKILYPH